MTIMPNQFSLVVLSLVGLIASIVLSITGCVPAVPTTPRARLEVAQARSAVLVEVLCADGMAPPWWEEGDVGLVPTRSTASGVIVSDHAVVTTAHTVACPALPRVRVTLTSGRRLEMVVTRIDEDRDIARLEVASADRFWQGIAPPALPDRDEDRAGVACVEAAYPKRGRMCGAIGFPGQLELATIKGNSGAPAYNDMGELLGIVEGSLRYADGSVGTRIASLDRTWL